MRGGRWKVFKRQKDAWLEEYRLCHAATLAITNLPSSITGLIVMPALATSILRSVNEVRAWFPEADLSNLCLHPAAHRAIEIEQPGGRTDKRGAVCAAG